MDSWLALSDLNGGLELVERFWGGWVTQQTVQFGSRITSLAASGDRVVVGLALAPMQGEVQVWRVVNSVWAVEQRLFPSRPAALGARFGADVAFAGGRIVVGAPGDDEVAPGAGAVEVFELGPLGFAPVARLIDPSGSADSSLGETVAHAGELVVAGALERRDSSSFYTVHLEDAQPVLVFERQGGQWPLAARLRSPSVHADAFGAAIGTDGIAVAVGAPGDRVTWAARGRVDVFEPLAGTLARVAEHRWIPGISLGGASYSFGATLVMGHGVLVVSDRDHVTWGWLNGGGIDVFTRRVTGPSPGAVAWERDFAWSAAQTCTLGGGALALYGPNLAVTSSDHGCVDFVELASSEGRRYCQAEQGTYGYGLADPPGFEREDLRFELFAAGAPVAVGGRTYLAAFRAPFVDITSLQLLASLSPGAFANPNGSRGMLCIGGALARRTVTAAEIDPHHGSIELVLDWSNLPFGVLAVPGQTWHFQMYGRRAFHGVFSGAVALTLR